MRPPAQRTAVCDGVTYAPGSTFRVTSDNAVLSGSMPGPGGILAEWEQALRPGDLLTCTGDGPALGSDPGCTIGFTSAESERAGAFHCELGPAAGGPLTVRPAPGLVTPTRDTEVPATAGAGRRRSQDGLPRAAGTAALVPRTR